MDADDLVAFAATRIAERPALPKAVRMLDALPLTAVGKVYLPRLRLDAMERAATAALSDLAPPILAEVIGREGAAGQLELKVRVEGSNVARAEKVLGAFTFRSVVLPA